MNRRELLAGTAGAVAAGVLAKVGLGQSLPSSPFRMDGIQDFLWLEVSHLNQPTMLIEAWWRDLRHAMRTLGASCTRDTVLVFNFLDKPGLRCTVGGLIVLGNRYYEQVFGELPRSLPGDKIRLGNVPYEEIAKTVAEANRT